MNKLGEKFLSIPGVLILLFIVRVMVAMLPFAAIGVPFWLDMILIGVSYWFPITTIIFWIWGLIATIQGPQDFLAIIYYVAFVVAWLPFFISTVTNIWNSIRWKSQQ